MCFSATASFTVGTFLVGLGTITVSMARAKTELPFAAIPLLFGIQQLSEGVVWLSFTYESAALNFIMTQVFSFFSHVLWPVYVPAAVLAIEPIPQRRRVLVFLLAAGLGAGGYLLYSMIASPIVAQPTGGHVEYLSPHFFALASISAYVAATTISPLASSHRTVKVFGMLAFASLVAAYLIYARWFISVWCLFAALMSVVVVFHFLRPEARKNFLPRSRQ
jgi:hypothetical protein